MIKDGWHRFKGQDVFIENGYIKRGITGTTGSYKTVYPYRWVKKYNCFSIWQPKATYYNIYRVDEWL